MENASKALIIAGAILLSILIIAIGMFIYSSANNTINDAALQMNATEKATFNSQFTQYEGKQIGTQVNQMIGKLISNANTNEDASEKLPDLVIEAVDGKVGYVISDLLQNYENYGANVDGFSAARSSVENRHTYHVWTDVNPVSGLVDLIVVEYEKDDILEKLDDGVIRDTSKKAKTVKTADIAKTLDSSAKELTKSTERVKGGTTTS